MVIVISGKRHSGKTTLQHELAKLFKENGYETGFLKFAGPVYAIQNMIYDYLDTLGMGEYRVEKNRKMLQVIGTELGRECIDQNLWVKIAQKTVEADPDKIWIPEDCRFPNEFEAFPDAISVRLDCPSSVRMKRCIDLGLEWNEEAESHPSETALDDHANRHEFDIYVDTVNCSPANAALDIFDFFKKTVERRKRKAEL